MRLDPEPARCRRAVVVLLTLAGFVSAAAAQTRESEFEALNFAFAAYVGSGIYSGGDQTVWLLRIPITVPILPAEDRPFGLRLRVRATFGFYDFDPGDLTAIGIPDSVGTFSLLAGVDMPIRIRDNWTLGPFLDGGPAWDSETETWSGVIGIGVLSRAEFLLKSERRFVLWNELVRASNFGNGEFEEEGFGKFLTDLEYRIPLSWTVGGKRMAVGPFVKAVWLFDALEIGGILDDEKTIRARYEVGFKIGAENRERIWRIPVPRLGLSYRFGQGVTSVRFIFSSRY